jgi:hypothetical protein
VQLVNSKVEQGKYSAGSVPSASAAWNESKTSQGNPMVNFSTILYFGKMYNFEGTSVISKMIEPVHWKCPCCPGFLMFFGILLIKKFLLGGEC